MKKEKKKQFYNHHSNDWYKQESIMNAKTHMRKLEKVQDISLFQSTSHKYLFNTESKIVTL